MGQAASEYVLSLSVSLSITKVCSYCTDLSLYISKASLFVLQVSFGLLIEVQILRGFFWFLLLLLLFFCSVNMLL